MCLLDKCQSLQVNILVCMVPFIMRPIVLNPTLWGYPYSSMLYLEVARLTNLVRGLWTSELWD